MSSLLLQILKYFTMSEGNTRSSLADTVNPSTLNLSNYIAVPGKIIPIPGTEYVIISPINTDGSSPSASCSIQSSSPAPPPLSAQIRRRGRPSGKSKPCQCPNCQEMPGADRHLCHFANCGKTFTKSCHLEAHLRNHMGSKPYQCPEPGCGVKFVRPDDLKRHSFKHNNNNCKYMCRGCGRGFYRKDHFNKHTMSCNEDQEVSQEDLVEEENYHIQGHGFVEQGPSQI